MCHNLISRLDLFYYKQNIENIFKKSIASKVKEEIKVMSLNILSDIIINVYSKEKNNPMLSEFKRYAKQTSDILHAHSMTVHTIKYKRNS